MQIIHVSPTGKDNNSGSKEAPWSLNRLNSIDYRPERILFESGKKFNAPLNMSLLPSVGNTVILGNYGDGSLPVLTGEKVISGWIKEANGVWSKTDLSFNDLQLLTIDGKTQPKGRFPKKGQLIVDSASGTSTITSKGLSGTGNFKGAEIIINEASWVENKGWVTDHKGTTLTYNDYSDKYTAKPKYGFFLQNHYSCLTEFGDWMFNNTSKKLYMYFGNEDPNKYVVKVANENQVVNIKGKSNLFFEGVGIEYGLADCVSIDNAKDIFIVESSIQFAGKHGIKHYENVSEFVLSSSLIQDTFNQAVCAHKTKGISIIDSTIRRNYIHAGTAYGDDQQGSTLALCINGTEGGDIYCIDNTIEDSGYNAIHFSMSNVTISNNKIRRAGLTKEDTGGIYCFGGSTTFTNRKIIGNTIKDIVTNLPDPWGAPQAKAIYLDQNTHNVEVRDNKIFNVLTGIYLHQASNNKIIGNQVKDSHVTSLLIKEGGWNEYSGNTFETEKGDFIQTVKTVISGQIDKNKYIRSNKTASFSSEYGAVKYPSIESWRSAKGVDANSVVTNIPEVVDEPEVIEPLPPVIDPETKPEPETEKLNLSVEFKGDIIINGISLKELLTSLNK